MTRSLRPYETLLLIDARLNDGDVEAAIERFSTLVSEQGGSVDNLDRWGRRRLAYDIEDLQEGYYTVVKYQVDPDKRQAIEDAMPFIEGLVRHKTVRPETRVRNA